MKILLLNLIFLIPFSCLIAQNAEVESTQKNYVGINFGGIYSKIEVKSNSQTKLILNAAPFYGRSVKRFVFGIGASFGYNYNKTPQSSYYGNNTYYNTEKNIEYVLLPTIRYYTKFNLFLTSSFNIGIGTGASSTPVLNARDIYYFHMDNSNTIIGASFGIGYAIKAGKSFFIEPQISVQKIYNEISYNAYPSAPSIYFDNYRYKVNKEFLNVLIGLGTTYRF